MDLLLGRVADLDSGHDQFEFLDDDALDFKEVGVILIARFLGAGQTEEMIKLFPTFEVVLHLLDEPVQLFVAHKVWVSGLFEGRGRSGRREKNNCAAAQFARGYSKTWVVNDELRKWQLGVGGLAEGRENV